jgi:transcriptional regulator with XRE-family HTH domain
VDRVRPFSAVAEAALEQLRYKLDSGEFTERGFARMAHVSQGALNNILHGKRRPSLEMMDRICQAARTHPLGEAPERQWRHASDHA